ncbi:hypothetical protein DENSPDRAFT_474581 [Dentipellis sp. KUC8613]|nr:hypothetical protein DENSPDRAFT_474581 [Dentipellis sp. KUC8613]
MALHPRCAVFSSSQSAGAVTVTVIASRPLYLCRQAHLQAFEVQCQIKIVNREAVSAVRILLDLVKSGRCKAYWDWHAVYQ